MAHLEGYCDSEYKWKALMVLSLPDLRKLLIISLSLLLFSIYFPWIDGKHKHGKQMRHLYLDEACGVSLLVRRQDRVLVQKRNKKFAIK